MNPFLNHKERSSVFAPRLFQISFSEFAWFGTDKHRKQISENRFFLPKSPRVVSWESKTNSSGGLRWCEVNCSRHKAHNALGLEVNSNLIMSGPHLAPLPEFVRHSPPAAPVITHEPESCEITGTAPLLLFLILRLFFSPSPQTVSPSSPANSPNSELLLFWKDTFLDVIKILLGEQMLRDA